MSWPVLARLHAQRGAVSLASSVHSGHELLFVLMWHNGIRTDNVQLMSNRRKASICNVCTDGATDATATIPANQPGRIMIVEGDFNCAALAMDLDI